MLARAFSLRTRSDMSNATLAFPAVAVEFMNHDHAAFADLHRRLLDLLDTAASPATIDHALDDLVRHTRAHFADEEKLMRDVGFPAYPIHQGEHERVLAEMSARIDAWRRDHDFATLADWMRSDVAEWFVGHIASMDMMTARFAAMQGRA